MLFLSSTINLVYVLEIQIWMIWSKDINLRYFCKVYCKELEQYMMRFDAFEKKCNETTNYII